MFFIILENPDYSFYNAKQYVNFVLLNSYSSYENPDEYRQEPTNMRLCEKDDFERVDAVDTYTRMKNQYGQASLVCPDYE